MYVNIFHLPGLGRMPIPPSTGGLFEAVVGQREEMRHGQNEGRSVLRTLGSTSIFGKGLLDTLW